jgi:hypothetical protein
VKQYEIFPCSNSIIPHFMIDIILELLITRL